MQGNPESFVVSTEETADLPHLSELLRRPDLDAFAESAALAFGASIGLLTVVHGGRLHVVGRYGTDLPSAPLRGAPCGLTLSATDVLVIEDTRRADAVFSGPAAEHPYFYAGAALRASNGLPFGTICVLDDSLTEATPRQRRSLALLAEHAARAVLHDEPGSSQLSQDLQLMSGRLLSLVHSIEAGVLVEDAEGLVVLANDRFSAMFGFEEASAQLYGAPRTEIAHRIAEHFPEPTRFAARVEGLVQEGSAHASEELHLIDGRILLRDYAPIVVESAVEGQLWIYRDVTARRRSQARLLSAAQAVSAATGAAFFTGFVDSLADAVGADYVHVGEVNEASDAVKIIAAHGYSAAGRSYPLERTPCFEVVRRELCTYPANVQSSFPEDQALVDLGVEGYAGCPLTDGAGRVTGIIVTLFRTPIAEAEATESLLRIFATRASAELERMHQEDRLLAAKSAAEAGNRAKSEFLASMSHELRTPLTGIVGYGQLLGASALDEEQTEYVRAIERSSDALLRIIDDLLDLSRIDAGELSVECIPFDPCPILLDAVGDARSLASAKGLRLDVDCACDHMLVVGDSGRVRQVLSNLIGNALKFTPEGHVRVSVQTRADRLHFEVEDSGIGIPEHLQAMVFDKFAQADTSSTRRFGGAGLGLAISRQLVTLMNGEIGLVSHPGRGSLFWFELPARVRSSPPRRRSSTPAHLPVTDAERGRVLLAEDNPVNQALARRFLERLGCKVDVVPNGEGAVRGFERGGYDLILMDCHMEGMDGFAATTAVREIEGTAAERIPVIAFTASALDEDRARCFAAGMDDVLTKPIRLEALDAMLARWLPQGQI